MATDQDPMPTVLMDPLVSPMPLTTPNRRGGLQPYVAPSRGSLERPDFRGAMAPLREIVPESVPFLDTHGQLQRDQQRRDRQAAADRERIAAMPTKEEQLVRDVAALKADLADLRTSVARLERQGRTRSVSRGPDDFTPPRAA